MKLLADAKREHDYDIAIAISTYVNRAFMEKGFNPQTANPFRQSKIKADPKEGFALLRAGLANFIKTQGKGK